MFYFFYISLMVASAAYIYYPRGVIFFRFWWRALTRSHSVCDISLCTDIEVHLIGGSLGS